MKIQLKRSSVLDGGAAKEPTAGQMEYGELAVNYNESDPAIFLKDSNNNIIRISGVGNISDDGQVEVPSSNAPPVSPEAGNLWYNSEDGRLYIYYTDANSSQWVDASPDAYNPGEFPDLSNPNNQPGTIDDRYVNITGDNMTGPLTLGTDKITLNATDGSATFAGDLFVNATNDTGVIARFRNNGTSSQPAIVIDGVNRDGEPALSIAKSDGQGDVTITNDGQVALGPSVGTGTPATIYLDGRDGSADFRSLYTGGTVHDAVAGVNNSFFRRSHSGLSLDCKVSLPLVTDSNSPTGQSFITASNNGTQYFNVGTDGSARFAGRVGINTPSSNEARLNVAGTLAAAGVAISTDPLDINNTTTAKINNDGSASFAGSVTSDSFFRSRRTEGSFYVINGNLNGVETSAIYADGSAEFKGAFTCFGKNGTAAKVAITNPSNRVALVGYSAANTNTFKIDADNGSATFAGTVELARVGANAAVAITSSSFGINETLLGGSAGPQYLRYNNSNGTVTFASTREAISVEGVTIELEPDNPANYTTTTDSEGNETQVYNGPTLDVKDRLTKTATALTALKAAASDSSTTLADLKSAFVAALADF